MTSPSAREFLPSIKNCFMFFSNFATVHAIFFQHTFSSVRVSCYQDGREANTQLRLKPLPHGMLPSLPQDASLRKPFLPHPPVPLRSGHRASPGLFRFRTRRLLQHMLQCPDFMKAG